MSRFLALLLCATSLLGITHSSWAEEAAPFKGVTITSTPLEQTLFESSQPISVLEGSSLLLQSKGTLGETLSTQPGITSTSFGPGAGRPIIRGLGGDRIRILQNGTGTQDVSNSSPDHAVSTESVLADKIEVVRGPATLMYGSSAVGGVVNTIDGRIPEELPQTPITGRFETRGATVNDERSVATSLTAPIGNVAVHIESFARKSDDIKIPGFARTEAKRIAEPELEYPEPKGTLPFSDTNSQSITLGSSYILKDGFLGMAGTLFNTEYGVPNGEDNISIDMRQPRLDIHGKLYEPTEFLKYMNFKMGLATYKHTEFEGEEVGTVFKNRGVDGRYEVAHEKIGGFEGVLGVQLQTGRFSADGEEAFQPNTATDIYSVYLFEEKPVSEDLKLQFGLRTDSQKTSASQYRDPISDTIANLDRNFDTFSQSAGFVWTPHNDYALALSFAHTERAPAGQELFANGPHVATGAYEIGDPNLERERSIGVDLTLRKREGRITGSLGGFMNRFNNYIGLNPTGEVFEPRSVSRHEDEDHASEDHHEDEHQDEEEGHDHEDEHDHISNLPIYRFENQNVTFYGVESELAVHLFGTTLTERKKNDLTLRIQPDWVWAEDRNSNEALPRVPPLRIKTGVDYRHENLGASFDILRVFEQDRVADFETSTDAYTMLNASISYDITFAGYPTTLFLRGDNLTNEEARQHTSFIKDVAPLGGRSAIAGLRFEF